MQITLQRRKPAHCPHCDAIVADALECGPAPKAGSFTMCWQCKETLRFNRHFQLRRLTDDDRRTLDLSPATRRELAQLAIAIAVTAMKSTKGQP